MSTDNKDDTTMVRLIDRGIRKMYHIREIGSQEEIRYIELSENDAQQLLDELLDLDL